MVLPGATDFAILRCPPRLIGCPARNFYKGICAICSEFATFHTNDSQTKSLTVLDQASESLIFVPLKWLPKCLGRCPRSKEPRGSVSLEIRERPPCMMDGPRRPSSRLEGSFLIVCGDHRGRPQLVGRNNVGLQACTMMGKIAKVMRCFSQLWSCRGCPPSKIDDASRACTASKSCRIFHSINRSTSAETATVTELTLQDPARCLQLLRGDRVMVTTIWSWA